VHQESDSWGWFAVYLEGEDLTYIYSSKAFENCKSIVLCLKSSFLGSLLDWAVAYVPNFSPNLVDFVYSFRFSSPLGWLHLLYIFRVRGLCFF
jgi:hypothetical protein